MPHSKAGEAPAEQKKSGVKPPHSKAGEAPAEQKKSGVKPPHSKAGEAPAAESAAYGRRKEKPARGLPSLRGRHPV